MGMNVKETCIESDKNVPLEYTLCIHACRLTTENFLDGLICYAQGQFSNGRENDFLFLFWLNCYFIIFSRLYDGCRTINIKTKSRITISHSLSLNRTWLKTIVPRFYFLFFFKWKLFNLCSVNRVQKIKFSFSHIFHMLTYIWNAKNTQKFYLLITLWIRNKPSK